jgi:Fic family protein
LRISRNSLISARIVFRPAKRTSIATRTPRGPHGRQIRVASGYVAYVPDPLPPPIAWDAGLAARLSEADRAIGRLAGEGRRLRNPHLLIRPFVRREAVLSSRIEGTQATLGELLAAEAGAVVERSPDDLREVANYVAALEYGVTRLEQLPVSLRLVRELHDQLMRGVRGGSATPGEFRRSQNWIGPPGSTIVDAVFVPPPPDRLMECLGAWETFLHETSLPPLVHIGLAHAQFEAIHPFLDGNGRVGRLVNTLLLIAKGVLPAPLLYLSAYFDDARQEYYARLLGVTQRGEWEEWLEYFLAGVAQQADDAVDRIQRVDDLLLGWREKVADSQSRLPERVIDLFVENPFWTVRRLSDRLDVAFTTAQRAIDRLEGVGIVTLAQEAKRNRVYCASGLLEILEAPRIGSGMPHSAPRP